jgi:phosphoribosylformimino-5-aminoimidazole carboxamide ribotide isomerase
LDDIRALCNVKEEGIIGAIIGRALYEGSIDLAVAQKFVDTAIN